MLRLTLLCALLTALPARAESPASQALALAAGASWDGAPAAEEGAVEPGLGAWGAAGTHLLIGRATAGLRPGGQGPVPARPPLTVEPTSLLGRGIPAGPVPAPAESASLPAGPLPSGAGFAEVWDYLKREPLSAPYPKASVTLWSFFKGFAFRLLGSARRTLEDERDILPDFDKLIRPNGIALAGVWEMTEESPYTGYFSQGSRAPVIARASVFSDEVEPGRYRSFGLALKLFPPAEPAPPGPTANVFLIDDNGGTMTPRFTDAVLVTKPKLSFHAGLLWQMPVLALVSLAQRLADKEPGYRQLYPVSELGLAPEELAAARSPGRLMVRGAEGTARLEAPDFREELDAGKHPGGLVFDVYAGEGPEPPAEGDPGWRRIGRLTFSESVVSRAVDHNLHFPHPRHRAPAAGGYTAVSNGG